MIVVRIICVLIALVALPISGGWTKAAWQSLPRNSTFMGYAFDFVTFALGVLAVAASLLVIFTGLLA